LRVSILVLLDVCKERGFSTILIWSLIHVSILVLLDVCKELRSKENCGKKSEVSILVLLDVCKER